MQKSLAPIVLSIIFLSACSTTVIDESERKLPDLKGQVIEEGGTPTFEVDHSQSFIAFKGSKGGMVHHEGKFEDFDLKITVDPENPTDSTLAKAEVSINIKSMVTDSDGLTKHLLSEDFFEAEKYPQAKFVTTSVTPSGEDSYDVVADLTIKDVTASVSFPIKMTAQYLTFNYDLDRTTFGVGGPPSAIKGVDAIVPVEVKVVFK